MNFDLAYIGAWATMIGGIWFLFEKADETIAPDRKQSISDWLSSPHSFLFLRESIIVFGTLFDHTFGSKHFTFRCFLASSVASMITVTSLALLWIVVDYQGFSSFISKWGGGSYPLLLILGGVINIFIDYLSLLETRNIIKLIETNKANIFILSFLIVDLFITFILSIVVVVLIVFALSGKMSLNILESGFHFSESYDGSINTGIFIYSTYFTSVWLWLFIISIFLLNTLDTFKRAMIFFSNTFNVIEKPIASIGYIVILFVSLIFLVTPVLYYVTNY